MIILNLEWSSFPSRDRESSTLVCNYLRFQNFKVIEGCIYDALHLIHKHKPNALYMSNIGGSRLNFIVAKFAHDLGIAVYSSHAEGDFAEENITEFVWGHNYEKKNIESKIFFWSKRNASLTAKYNNDILSKIYITGSPGHDKYIVQKKKKISNFRKVNIACFDFSFTNNLHPNNKLFSNETINFFREQMLLFDEILFDVIKNNPQIQFYIKQHPSTILGLKYSGVENSSKLPNVFIVNKNSSILDFLNSASICISYQSNTSLESWLLDNISITLNPKTTAWPTDIYRTPFHKAQFVCHSFLQLDNLLKNLETNNLTELEVYNRSKLIKNIIGYSDGLNHVRIGNYMINNTRNDNVNFFSFLKFFSNVNYILIKNQFLWFTKKIFFVLRKRSYSITKILEWRDKELLEYQLNILNKQAEFYNSIDLDKEKLLAIKGQIFENSESINEISHNHIDFN